MSTPLTLSHSQMELFTGCNRRWQLTKLNKVSQAPSEALIFGDAAHQAIEADGKAAIAGETRFDIARLVTHFSRALQERLRQDDPQHLISAQTIAAMRLRGLATLRAYAEQFQAAYHPDAVEAPFPDVLLPSTYTGAPDVRFTGRLDARSGQTILDFKSASRPWDIGREHKADQATAYLWADQRAHGESAAKQVRFVVLSTTSVEQRGSDGYVASVDIRVTTRTQAQIAAYEDKVRRVATYIAIAKRDGVFQANPGPLCGWCDVCHHCKVGQNWLKSRGRRPQPAIEALMPEGTFANV